MSYHIFACAPGWEGSYEATMRACWGDRYTLDNLDRNVQKIKMVPLKRIPSEDLSHSDLPCERMRNIEITCPCYTDHPNGQLVDPIYSSVNNL